MKRLSLNSAIRTITAITGALMTFGSNDPTLRINIIGLAMMAAVVAYTYRRDIIRSIQGAA